MCRQIIVCVATLGVRNVTRPLILCGNGNFL